MLVCKVYETESSCLVAGSCFIKGYETGGWFPINSFSFEVPDPDNDSSGDNKSPGGKGASGSSVGARPGASPAAPAQQRGSAGNGKKPESSVSISKSVDTGTCDLMYLAMKERKKTKGAESKIKADIHLLSVVDVKGGARFTFPNLMVHLEGVIVKSWQLDASGDDRGTETMRFQYDRIAVNYTSTGDGKYFVFGAPRGWNQTENQPFDWGNSWDKYLTHLK